MIITRSTGEEGFKEILSNQYVNNMVDYNKSEKFIDVYFVGNDSLLVVVEDNFLQNTKHEADNVIGFAENHEIMKTSKK